MSTAPNSPIDEVVDAHHALAAAGQSDLVWGHVGVRDPDGRGVWTKAAGWGFEEITADRVVLVSWDGTVLYGTGPRHIEYPIHTETLTAQSALRCVVHTHPEAVNAFAALDVPIRAINHDGVPFSGARLPRFDGTAGLIRTRELGIAAASALGRAPALLLPPPRPGRRRDEHRTGRHACGAPGTGVPHPARRHGRRRASRLLRRRRGGQQERRMLERRADRGGLAVSAPAREQGACGT